VTGEAVQAQFLYIVLSRTNTGVGRLIRLFLRSSHYNHVSAALDGRLYLLYSFSRTRKDSPFSGGFVQEYPSRYFAMGKNVDVKVFRVPLPEAEYRVAFDKLSYCRASGGNALQLVRRHDPGFFRALLRALDAAGRGLARRNRRLRVRSTDGCARSNRWSVFFSAETTYPERRNTIRRKQKCCLNAPKKKMPPEAKQSARTSPPCVKKRG
jgi:hypothetical protein